MRKRIRDIRHDELVEATIQAIHKTGYAGITLAMIGDEVGASAASINYYFGSKEKLMGATMQRLLALLHAAHLERLATAEGPRARLDALVAANFDDRLFTPAQCSVWVQFWAAAPYAPDLARLQRINRARVRSHARACLVPLVPQPEEARRALQAYMDGVWVAAAQGGAPGAAEARAKATSFTARLLGD